MSLFKMNQYLNWEQAPTQQQAAQELRNFIAKMNKIYREIQTPKTEQYNPAYLCNRIHVN